MMLNPGTFWSKVLNVRGAPVTLVSSMVSIPGRRAAAGSGSSERLRPKAGSRQRGDLESSEPRAETPEAPAGRRAPRAWRALA